MDSTATFASQRNEVSVPAAPLHRSKFGFGSGVGGSPVSLGPADEDVVTRSSVDIVAALAAEQHIGAGTARQHVGADAADQGVVAATTGSHVVALRKRQEVVARAAVDEVAARAGQDLVVAGTRDHDVRAARCLRVAEETEVVGRDRFVAVSGDDSVVAKPPADQVVAAEGDDDVVTALRDNHVGFRGAEQHVARIGADDRARRRVRTRVLLLGDGDLGEAEGPHHCGDATRLSGASDGTRSIFFAPPEDIQFSAVSHPRPSKTPAAGAADPWRLNELVRRRRLREQGRRSPAANLAEGLALSEFLSRFRGAARQ
jgi:hypothetical protein